MSRELSRIESLEVDLVANTLKLILTSDVADGDAVETKSVTATIEVGVGGQLIGVDMPEGYIDVMEPEPGTEALIRSSDAEVVVERAEEQGGIRAIVVPRKDHGYEITYPSGNQ